MTGLLVVLFIIYILGSFVKAGQLGFCDYPRTEEYPQYGDVLSLLIRIGIAIWIGCYIF